MDDLEIIPQRSELFDVAIFSVKQHCHELNLMCHLTMVFQNELKWLMSLC